MHVTRANLNQIHVFNEAFNFVGGHNFGNDGQASCFTRSLEVIQAQLLQALEGVRGGTGLKSAATQQGCAASFNILSYCGNLLDAFYGAGTGDNLDFFATDGHTGYVNNAILRMEGTVGTFKGLLHTHNLFYALVNEEQVHIQCAGVANYAKQGCVHAFAGMDLVASSL